MGSFHTSLRVSCLKNLVERIVWQTFLSNKLKLPYSVILPQSTIKRLATALQYFLIISSFFPTSMLLHSEQSWLRQCLKLSECLEFN